jgi:glycosyltransferase involved in cell wall biosynthesis
MGQPKIDLSVLIPAYNEQAALQACVEKIRNRLIELNCSYEILVVDDGSLDQTGTIADRLAVLYPEVRTFHHPANRGIGAGFHTGVQQALGEWFILIPADLPLDLQDLDCYLSAARQADFVVGLRSDRRDYTPFRKLVSWVNIHLIQLLFGLRLRQYNYISMYRTSILRGFNIHSWNSAFFYAEIFVNAQDLDCRLVEVEIHYKPRSSGQATGANWKLILRTVQDLFTFWLSHNLFRHRPGSIQPHE